MDQRVIHVDEQCAFGCEVAAHVHAACGIELQHILHAAALLGQSQHGGNACIREFFALHGQFVIACRFAEELFQRFGMLRFALAAQCVGDVRVHALELDVFTHALEHLHILRVDHLREVDDLNALSLKHRDVLRLQLGIRCVVNGVFVRFFCAFKVLGERYIAAVYDFHEERVFRLIIELAVAECGVFAESLDVAPHLFKALAVILEERVQLVGNLFDDVRRDLGNIAVILQVASRNIEGQLGAVEHAAQHQEIFGDDFLDVVGNEYLVVVELDLSFHVGKLMREFREVQNALEVEGVVRLDVQPEERIVEVTEYLVVERFVLLVGAFGGILLPQGHRVVDRLFLGDFFAFLGFFRILVCKVDLDRHERTVFFEYRAQFIRLEVLCALVVDMHDDGRAAILFVVGDIHFIGALVRADPLHGIAAAVGTAAYLYAVADHKRRVKAETEVTDDTVGRALAFALILLDKLHCARQCDVADVLLDLIGIHTDTVIRYGDGARLLADADRDLAVKGEVADLSERDQTLQLCDRVGCVGNDLAQENLLVRVEPTLDDREYMLGLDGNTALFIFNFFCHGKFIFLFKIF